MGRTAGCASVLTRQVSRGGPCDERRARRAERRSGRYVRPRTLALGARAVTLGAVHDAARDHAPPAGGPPDLPDGDRRAHRRGPARAARPRPPRGRGRRGRVVPAALRRDALALPARLRAVAAERRPARGRPGVAAPALGAGRRARGGRADGRARRSGAARRHRGRGLPDELRAAPPAEPARGARRGRRDAPRRPARPALSLAPDRRRRGRGHGPPAARPAHRHRRDGPRAMPPTSPPTCSTATSTGWSTAAATCASAARRRPSGRSRSRTRSPDWPATGCTSRAARRRRRACAHASGAARPARSRTTCWTPRSGARSSPASSRSRRSRRARVRAEALATAALLSGPDAAARVLARHGGIAFDDAGVEHRFGALAVPVRRRMRIA